MCILSLFNLFEDYPHCKSHYHQPTKTHTHPCYKFHVNGMTVIMVVGMCVTDVFEYEFCTVIHYYILKFDLSVYHMGNFEHNEG